MSRFGVKLNAIAPAARTPMTEVVFAQTMAKPETGFDPMAPENVSPLVVWLASDDCDVTGRVFEVEAGIISVADGWQHGPREDRGDAGRSARSARPCASCSPRRRAPAPVYGA